MMRNLLSRDLSALLGRTRAAVLEAIADGGGTNVLAGRLGISPASVSEHAAVLRAAGLVVTVRARTGVRHELTPLGAALLGAPGGRSCRGSAAGINCEHDRNGPPTAVAPYSCYASSRGRNHVAATAIDSSHVPRGRAR
ncbi:winged helix-turn-helix domain-containing protein [Nocardia sp. NPDC051030]|uniref:winged helix-turn-helix domain-containing protein n=1 Tax=Nocardia sp. NPDC051030 TaxID=3155162 RepID=UPI003441F70D